jgi:uncharacterized protein (DUF2267 family)
MGKDRIKEEVKRDLGNIESLLNDFGNHSLRQGKVMYSSNDVAKAVTGYLSKERLNEISDYLNIKYKDVWKELAK